MSQTINPVWVELAQLARQKAAERSEEAQLKPLGFAESGKSQTLPSTGAICPKTGYIEHQRWRAEAFNRSAGKLSGYDCPECRNRGCFYRADEEGHLVSVPCKCMTIRANRQRMEQSGLADMLKRYTFDAWETAEDWQAELLESAKRYAENPDGWFSVCGKPGTGKTHICTAVCGALMEKGIEVRYALWRDVATTLKALSVREAAEYNREIEPLKTVQCLYIDDLFKTGGGRQPTVMDVNLAFEIINARYNASGLITVISSERSLDELMRIDEAVASRIYERTKQNRNYFNLAKKENWRMTETGGGYGP